MPLESTHALGWSADLQDHRDYSPNRDSVVKLLSRLKTRRRGAASLPQSVDWREYCGPIEDQHGLPTSSAHACTALVQQFERRSSGALLKLSRRFADYTARRQSGSAAGSNVQLRPTLKAIVRCGVPPEEYWPYDVSAPEQRPDAFLYTFGHEYRAIRYVRLDPRESTGDEILARLKSYLAAGFCFAFGFPVCRLMGQEAEIPFPTNSDIVVGGLAVTAVGYDDRRRIRSDRGALIVRNSWGTDWGDGGFGWLPYSYVQQRLACDFWTLLRPAWIRSGEFEMPR